MRSWLLDLPLFIQLIAIGAVAMYVPAIMAFVQNDHFTSRSFFYSGTLFLFVAILIGFALANVRPRLDQRNQLLALLAAFSVLPLVLAVPFYEAVQTTSFLNAYFEMVSAMTTTGATLFDDPARLAPPVHLWRAIVGWLGGFLAWLMAAAILAPMSLGGFEMTSEKTAGQGRTRFAQIGQQVTATDRVARFSAKLFPIYASLTLVLWVLLILAGDVPFVALCHAMSTLATSGISPLSGLENHASGWVGEGLIALFLFFALTRHSFMPVRTLSFSSRLRQDRELRVGLFFIVTVPALLFLRHWVGAYEVNEEEKILSVFQALWGSLFTVLSFLTTTGFVSAGWEMAGDWSGLRSPGVVLMGLALIGGGVATTAGGVKLFRVYALYKHGLREMEKLVHPSSVGGAGRTSRQIRRQGAYIAWIFFMVFALSIAAVTMLLTMTGLSLESGMIFAVSSLSTTGPLAEATGELALTYGDLGAAAKLILAGAMVLGRLEALAIIALLNPDFWRA